MEKPSGPKPKYTKILKIISMSIFSYSCAVFRYPNSLEGLRFLTCFLMLLPRAVNKRQNPYEPEKEITANPVMLCKTTFHTK